MGKVGVTQTQESHHHILSPIEGVEGNSQTYPWVNVVEFVVDLTIPGVLPTVLNIIRNIVTEVREWDSYVRDWVLESLLCSDVRLLVARATDMAWDPE